MPVLVKIAVRNLLQHRAKTLIIGLILMFGMIILVMGNSLVNTITEGISKNYIENYSGNLIVSAKSPRAVSLFSMDTSSANGFAEPILQVPEYEKVKTRIAEDQRISAYSPQAATFGMMTKGEKGRTGGLLFGIDATEYRNMFPDNLDISSGKFLQNGEEGILLGARAQANLERTSGEKLQVGDKIQISGTTSTGAVKIREVTVRGLFSFRKASDELGGVSLVDIDTVRSLYGMTVGSNSKAELTPEDAKFLDASAETLFGGDLPMDAAIASSDASIPDFDNLLGDTSKSKALTMTDSGAYHYILLRLRDGVSQSSVQRDLEKYFAANDIDARVSPWLEGAGTTAKMAYNVKMVFQIIIMIIAIVAIIIIMNTLVISISERIPEIGTIRALGGTKGFVLRMITMETLVISLTAGLVGVIVSSIAVMVSGAIGISVTNELFKVLLGGAVFHPVLHLQTILVAFGIIVGVGIFSAAYPVAIAVAISPVTAMRAE
jgi:putative ABC transport system permease protein